LRLFYHYILLLLFLFAYSETPHFDLFELNDKIIEEIEQGKIITIKTNKDFGKAEHYQVYGIIDANIETVFNAVQNFDNYPEFMPRFDYVEKIENSDNINTYIFNILLPLSIKYKYKIKSKDYMGKTSAWLAWETIPWEENSIKETWGQWYLKPYENSDNKTLVQYQIYTDPGYIPFGFGWIVDALTKKSLPEIVENLKIWIEQNES